MKNYFIFLGLCCILFGTACKKANATKEELEIAETEESIFSEKAELEAIMAVIEKETNCFYERNFECWKAQWADKDYIVLTWNNEDGSFESNMGSSLTDYVRQYLVDHPLKEGETSTHASVKRENIKVQFYGDDAAYLTWKQYNGNSEATKYTISRDFRVMEKIGGEWKIVNVSSFWDYPNPQSSKDIQF